MTFNVARVKPNPQKKDPQKKDELPDFEQSLVELEALVAKLEQVGKKKGRDYFFEPSKGETHGFKGAELTKSRDATVEFFKKML